MCRQLDHVFFFISSSRGKGNHGLVDFVDTVFIRVHMILVYTICTVNLLFKYYVLFQEGGKEEYGFAHSEKKTRTRRTKPCTWETRINATKPTWRTKQPKSFLEGIPTKPAFIEICQIVHFWDHCESWFWAQRRKRKVSCGRIRGDLNPFALRQSVLKSIWKLDNLDAYF
jgi:hypothetical protein